MRQDERNALDAPYSLFPLRILLSALNTRQLMRRRCVMRVNVPLVDILAFQCGPENE